MSLKPPVGPNSPLGTGRVFWNVVTDGSAQAGVATSQHSAFQTAINAANTAGGGTVFVPDGTYTLTSGLTLYSNVHLQMAPNAILSFTGAAAGTNLISAAGAEATGVALTGNAAAGATSVSVAAGAESGFAAGDYVRVYSDSVYDANRTSSKIGEIAVVASTASGSITLKSPLAGGTYTTAASAKISKLTPVVNVGVSGGQILGGGTGLTHRGLKVQIGVRIRVRDVRFRNCEDTACWLYDVVDGLVDGLHVESSNYSQTGYGVNVTSASQDCTISNCYFRDCRHATTTTNASGAYGIPRRIFFTGCRAWDTISSGDCYDTHAASEGIHFRDCHSYDSGNVGFNIECSQASIVGCVVERSANHGILMNNGSDYPTQYLCSDNRVNNAGSMGIRFSNIDALGSGSTIRSVVISGNQIYNPTSRGIYVVSTDYRLHTVAVTGNTIRSCQSTTAAINVSLCDYFTLTGNVITDANSAAVGVRIDDVTYGAVTGNMVTFSAIGTSKGFSVTTGKELTVTGNIVTVAATGLQFDANSINCAVAYNNFQACTTAQSLSTGGGHVIGPSVPGEIPVTASAASITLPRHSDIHSISGTTNITSMTASNVWAGRRVTLIFQGILTFTDGSNLLLNGNFVTSADDTITLVCDGTNWIECSRSAN